MRKYSATKLIKSLLNKDLIASNDVIFLSIFDDDSSKYIYDTAQALFALDIRTVLSKRKGNIGKQIRTALKYDIRWFLMIGSEEIRQKQIKLKDLQKRKEYLISE